MISGTDLKTNSLLEQV